MRESFSFRLCGGLPRDVAVLGDRRPVLSCIAHLKGSAQAVKPDVCRCAAVQKKHISSSTISTKRRMTLTSYDANDTVNNSRKNRQKAGEDCRNDLTPKTGGRTRNLLRTIMSLGRCSLMKVQVCIERWESFVLRCEKKLKDTSDDEIKLAGLEALRLGNSRKHLILNSNRLRTFGDAARKS